MSKRNFSRTRQDENIRRYGSEALDGSSPTPNTPRQDSKRRDGPDLFHAIQKARYAVTDVGVRFACEAAAQGLSVIYANDWSPGEQNEDKLRAAGVDVVICKPKR